MTVKEAILKSLEDLNKISSYTEVYNHIVANNYCEFKRERPSSTVSTQLSNLIKQEDTRIKRVSTGAGTYSYYLTKNEHNLDISLNIATGLSNSKPVSAKPYHERDLHKILSSYLKNTNTFSKTIFHEQSLNSKDSNQKWIHPDMVGIKFLNIQTQVGRAFLKTVNRVDTFKIYSYELNHYGLEVHRFGAGGMKFLFQNNVVIVLIRWLTVVFQVLLH